MMKNAFYLTLKTHFFLKHLFFFGHVGKRLDEKAKVIFKIYDFMYWESDKCNTRIA